MDERAFALWSHAIRMRQIWRCEIVWPNAWSVSGLSARWQTDLRPSGWLAKPQRMNGVRCPVYIVRQMDDMRGEFLHREIVRIAEIRERMLQFHIVAESIIADSTVLGDYHQVVIKLRKSD